MRLETDAQGTQTEDFSVGGSTGRERPSPGTLAAQDFRNIPDRYQHPETIGTGGIGVVTSCLDPNLGRRVALKTLRRKHSQVTSLRERFVREARVMSQLEHPNIVPVHELGERPDGSIYFTMKEVHGETLEWVLQRLAEHDPAYLANYPRLRLIDIFVHICQAIAFAHSRGAIHRDLKPENVMIGAFGEVQIMDWGLVKVMAVADPADDGAAPPEEGSPEATFEGQVMGTPLYMAPEQASGRADQVDQRSDIYSLGAILYRMLTRCQHVGGTDVKSILHQVKNRQPTPPRRFRVDHHRVPRELSAICMKALAKRQEDRYQNVQEMLDDIARYQHELPVNAYRPSVYTRFCMCCHRHPIVRMSAVTAVVLTVGLFGALGLLRHQRMDDMLASARIYKAEGDAIAGQAMVLLDQQNRLRSAWCLKEPSPEEAALAHRLARLHQRSQANYDISCLFYARAVEMTKTPVLDFLCCLGTQEDGYRWRTSERRMLPICREVADAYRRQIDYELLAGNDSEARRLHELMGSWLRDIPGGDQDFLLWEAGVTQRLEARSTLRLVVDKPDAEVRLYQLRGDLGPPDLAQPDQCGGSVFSPPTLRSGSYLLVVGRGAQPDVIVPVLLDCGEEHDLSVHIPDLIPPGMVYVPAGPALVGGVYSPVYRQREIEVDGFFMKQFEVTFAEYLEFWFAEPDSARRAGLMAYVQLGPGAASRQPCWEATGK